ncbi:MAG TPA: alpha/beta fold hydrolase [Polyangiaceae bacterium LLY-WYZ-14_1]|nr:alpha/beta fold hydrolase [Polyangiaceae bacterium LLY-WYZ-14_1]
MATAVPLAAAGCGDDGKESAPLGFVEHDCTVTVPEGFTTDDLRCGTLTALQDRDGDPDGPRVEVEVAVVLARQAPGEPDPLVQVPGGPGVPLIDVFLPTDPVDLLAQVNQTRDLVYIDPRGTGRSGPDVQCAERQAEIDAAFVAPGGAAEDRAARIAGMMDCRERLTEAGIGLSDIHGGTIAADFVEVLDALGYDSYNLWGYSYGGRVAQDILRIAGDRVRSVILDAPSMPGRFPAESAMLEASLDLLFARCAASERCSEDHPDLEATFYALVEDLNETPAQVPVTLGGVSQTAFISGDRFIQGIQGAMNSNTILASIPQAITDTAAGNLGLLTLTIPRLLGGSGVVSTGHEASVLCAEVSPFWTRGDWEAETASVEPALVAALGPISYDVDVGQCDFWEVAPRPAEEATEPVSSDVPALLLHGEYDSSVPPSNSELALDTLSNAQRVLFPGYGHVVIGQNPDPAGESCEQQLLAAFLEDPGAPLDTTCVESLSDPF